MQGPKSDEEMFTMMERIYLSFILFQVSFLHLYHHVVTVLLSWIYAKYFAGVQGWALALINTLVHTIMYTYYFLSAVAPEYTKNAWWKKYITWVQLVRTSIP